MKSLEMRKTVIILLLVLAAVTAVGQGSKRMPPDKRGTVMLEIGRQVGPQARIRLQKAAEYHGRYYCQFYYQGRFPNGSGDLFFSVDKQSHEVRQLPWAEGSRDTRDVLFVFHDTLFITQYQYMSGENHDYFFDTVAAQWVECPRLEKIIYEDDDYRVYKNDHGEWGQTLWFEERRTGREWKYPGLGSVQRVGDTFFIVEENVVQRLTVSQLLATEPSKWNHRRANEDYANLGKDDSPWLESDTVYRDPRYDGFEAYIGKFHDTVIVGSFVSGDSLLLVVNRPDGTALMCIEGPQELRTVRLLDELYGYKPTFGSFRVREMSVLGRMLTDRVLIPFCRDFLSMGLLDISGDGVEVLEFGHNIDTLVAQPVDGLDTLLAYLRDHWNDITDSAMHRFEGAHGGSFLGTESIWRNGYFRDQGFREGHHIDYFEKHVDTLYSFGTEYCVHEGDGRVVAVFMGVWRPRCYNCEYVELGYDERQEREQELCRQMAARLDAICGPRHSRGREFFWHFGPLTVTYYPSRNRMLIY